MNFEDYIQDLHDEYCQQFFMMNQYEEGEHGSNEDATTEAD